MISNQPTTTAGIFPSESDSLMAAYTSYEQLKSLTQGALGLSIMYGHHHQRIRQKYVDEATQTATLKLWAGACEYITHNGQTTTLTYLSSPDGLYALHRILPDGSENIHYLHTDHLGSWTAVTDETGTIVDEQSYDACSVKLGFWECSEPKGLIEQIPPEARRREGNRRSPYTWRKTGLWQTPRYDRGFTGHEHLDGFQLNKMLSEAKSRSEAYAGNGRMYDPVVSRMLAPDNFVQTPDFSQNFNRYSYALNNPLMFTDPSGELFGIDDAIVITALAIIGAYTGGVGMNEGELNPISWDWQSPDTYFGIGFGALLGYVGGYGLVNPGTVSFALGLGSPAGGIYLAGNASDWNFEWSTAAGGGGSIDLSQPVSINDIVNGSNDRVKLPVVPNIASNTYFDDATQRWSNYASGMIFADLPEIEVKWDGIEGDAVTKVPYWWGMTDQMANPLTQSRVLNKGVEAIYLTLAVPTSIILGAEALGYFSTYKSYTLLRFGGKNRLDFSTDRWLLHYHRRGIGPGQGIGRHRPWQFRSSVEKWWEIWKRF